jgi:hypothetical protein
VAAFAGGSLGRLLAAQFIVALLVAATVVWFLRAAWFPVVRTAIEALPEQGAISKGQLDWDDESPVQLAENHFLGVAVDLYHSGRLGRAAHLQVEFGREDFRVYSLPGYEVFDYPPGLELSFNRPELEPWWGAWQPWIEVGAAAAMVLGLMALWQMLATLYFIPVRVIGFLEGRDLNWRQSWRLSGAAMLPGALFFGAGIAAYGSKALDLIELGAICGLQFVIGWIYLLASPLFCPRASAAAKKAKSNPFAASKEPGPEPAAKNPPARPPG